MSQYQSCGTNAPLKFVVARRLIFRFQKISIKEIIFHILTL